MHAYKPFPRIFVAFLIVMLLSTGVSPATPAYAAPTFTVNSRLDQPDDLTIPGTCHTAAGTCTLRAAIMQANRVSGAGATIIVPAGTYKLTIPVSGANGEENGDLNLTTPARDDPVITILGNGAERTMIDANQLDRVLSIAANRTVILTGLTIRNGFNERYGGGITNSGTLTVNRSRISKNQAWGGPGGGIDNLGLLTLNNSTISENQSVVGGGVYNVGTLTINHSTISGNQSSFDGGGILNNGNLIVVNTTISQNKAAEHGGGIFNTDGGIFNTDGTANIYNTTIVFNEADYDVNGSGGGGGVYNDSNGTFNLRNTLVAGNLGLVTTIKDDCYGTLNSYGRNLFGAKHDFCTINNVAGGSWTFLNSPSTIGPLANNGGPTFTHALLPGSNAIDAADPLQGCVDAHSALIPKDQRGAARTAGVSCDIGAYERHPTQNAESTASHDGWILETTETSNKGGTLNTTATTFFLGDDAQKKQYRSVLSFSTKGLPDNAVITKVTLKLKRQGVTGGGNPVKMLKGFMVDVKKGFFDSSARLQANDFQTKANKSYGPFKPALKKGWYTIDLSPASVYINRLNSKGGVTQIRLRFKLDDNNNAVANYLKLYSGNAPAASRPQLIIEYFVP